MRFTDDTLSGNSILTRESNIDTNDSKYLLVLNESQHTLVQSEADKYVFEGIAAELDVVNENNRIYTKEEYLKHLPYLQEKIRRGRLFGEIDHPQDYYEVKLRNMSHRIEDLWYDEPTNTIRIKIRLLVGLDGGDYAKKVVDLGIPLAISSRAIGKIIDNKPRILRIFTFDLVAEPGFRNAILNRVDETISWNDKTFKYSELAPIVEGVNSIQTNSILNHCSIYDSNCKDLKYNNYIHIYKINDKEVINELDGIFESNTNIQNNTIDMNQSEFNKFTKNTQQELNLLKSAILKINESLDGIQGQLQKQPDADFAQVPAQSQAQAQSQSQNQVQIQDEAQTTELPDITEDDSAEEAIEKMKMYLDFMSTQLTKKETEYQELQENVNAINNVMPIIGKALNKIINHENALTRKVNESLNYVDNELLGTINETANVTNTQSYLITKLIEMSDNISEDTSNIYEAANKINSIVAAQGGFMNMLARKINENEFEYNEEDMSQSEDVTDENAQDMSQSEDVTDENAQDMSQSEDVTDENATQINESGNAIATDKKNKIDNLFENIQQSANKILTKIENNKVDKILESQFPFLKLLSQQNKRTFFGLKDNTKKEIVTALNNGVYFNERDVMNIVESVVASQDINVPNHLKYMPVEFKPIYESLNPQKKNEIDMMAKSGFYKLETPYQVKSFWHSMDINESIKNYENDKHVDEFKNAEKLNESENQTNNENVEISDKFIYGHDYVDYILNS